MKNEISKKLKGCRAFSIIIILIGAALLTYMIKIESEPGALPLLLIFIGTVWLIINHIIIRKQTT